MRIDAISHEGRGIATVNGKIVFVLGALKDELVRIQIQKVNRKFDQASVLEILEVSPERIKPKCAAFARCGGCSLQHLSGWNQVRLKQQMLSEMMQRAGVKVSAMISPLVGDAWGYRRKARLGVKYVRKKGRVLVGFREYHTAFLTDMSQCEVLVPKIGHHLMELADLIGSLDAKDDIPQIEVAADDNVIQLVFRHLVALSDTDQEKLIQFARQTGFWIQLQPGGPDTVSNLYPDWQPLYFSPALDNNIRINFTAADFVQINHQINQKMVAQALDCLSLRSGDRVLDLFCGLGNFTLPMARQCASVIGVEGNQAMVRRAKENALENRIQNTDYFVANLNQIDSDWPWMHQRFDKILLDPPRSGAMQIAEIIERFRAETIVYIACQPASLVRDSQIICRQGYQLTNLGVIDMFPQTAHIESMAVFQR